MVFGVLWAVFFHPRVRDRFIEEIMSLDTLGFEVDIIVSERGVLDDDDLIQWLGRAERWNALILLQSQRQRHQNLQKHRKIASRGWRIG